MRYSVNISYSHNVFLPLCSWARMSGLSILVCASLKLSKGRHTTLQGTHSIRLSIQLTHSGGRVLRSGGLNHYNPSCPLVFIPNSPNRQPLRPLPHLRIRAGAFRHPAGEFPHRHLARQVGGFGFRFFACFLARHDGSDRRAPQLVSRGLPDGGRGNIFCATRLLPPCVWCCCYAHCAAAHARADIQGSIGGCSWWGVVCRQGVAAQPNKFHGLVRGHEIVARRCRPSPRMAHSGSAMPRPRSFRCQREASTSVRSPSVRGAQTDDLWVELNRQRAGEDARISLERADDLRAELNRRRAGEDARVSLERALSAGKTSRVAT
jgi:hypothetical protein